MYKIDEIRKQFPMLDNKTMQGKPLVYLDNAATTFKPQCVIDSMTEYYTTFTSNSGRGDYDLAYKVDTLVSESREKIAKFVNCETKEVVFTSGDTMSLNLVAYGYGLTHLNKGDEVIISEEEHASNFLPWIKVCEMTGAVLKYVPLNDFGKITIENLSKTVTNNTKIISLAHIGNVLGYVNDVKAFAKIAHGVGAIMVVDGAQSVPHIKIDFKDLDIDFLTFSAHKMCGPTGIGALIGKYELLQASDPFILGGGMNVTFGTNSKYIPFNAPVKFEAGTLNIAGIIGFGKAIDFLNEIGIDNISKHEKDLHEYAMEKLKNNENIIVYNPDAKGSIITFNRKGVFCQDEGTLLNSKGIAIRSGQHCAKALGGYLKEGVTCRASTYLYTSYEEIDAFIKALEEGGDFLDAYFSN